MSSESFFAITFGFLSGIFLASLFVKNLFVAIFVIFLGIIFFILSIVWRDNKKIFLVASLFLISCSLGLLRFEIDDSRSSSIPLNTFGQYEGIIVREPEYRETNVHITLEIGNSNILLFAPKDGRYQYGDRISFFGEINEPQNFESDNERIFDYRNFLLARNIEYIVFNPKIQIKEKGEGNYLREKLYALKAKFTKTIESNINAPESGLLLGILLGAKGALPDDIEDNFRKSGLSHIIVLSGFNMTIVASFIAICFHFTRRNIRIVLGAVSILLFALMVGGEATVVRASLMALIVMLAAYLRRRYAVTRALIFAGFLMVVISPKILVFDISFQLSFLATLGIVYATDFFESKLNFVSNILKLREIIVTTLSAQLLVSPFVIYSMGTFSLVSLFANILVLPLVPIVMLIGFVGGIAGFISSILALPFNIINYYLLHYMIVVGEYFGNLKLAEITFPPFSAWFLIPTYCLIAFIIFRYSNSDSLQRSS